jgi:hypothetical protein
MMDVLGLPGDLDVITTTVNVASSRVGRHRPLPADIPMGRPRSMRRRRRRVREADE